MPGTRRFFMVCLAISLAVVVLLAGSALKPHDVPSDVAAGYVVWQSNGCEGCHTIYGEGGPYASDLTNIYDQRGESYIREFMADPLTGSRVMLRFDLTASETSDLLAFLAWVGHQGIYWPPQPKEQHQG